MSAYAAAPDDITANQRAWFDAYDINANENYTDNPANGDLISTWSDKSGQSNAVSGTGTQQPQMQTGTADYGVKFTNDRLSKTGDIYSGNVTDIEKFIVSSLAGTSNNWLVSSVKSSTNTTDRIGTHVPWGNGNVYWDRGDCCTNSRLFTANSVAINQRIMWDFYASHGTTNAPDGATNNNKMYILKNADVIAKNGSTDTYSPTTSSIFGLGAQPNAGGGNYYNGVINEVIVYQRTLIHAERNIINSYLGARWNISGYATNDKYEGDTTANGDYDFHVGGIGIESTGDVEQGTSLGLTFNNITFFSSNGTYLLAGLDSLTPATGLTTFTGESEWERAQRIWYWDKTGATQAIANATFDLTEMGITANPGNEAALIYKSSQSGSFAIQQTSTVVGTSVSFDICCVADGYYTIAIQKQPSLTIKKTASVINDPVNGTTNPKMIPGAQLVYNIELLNSGYGSIDTDTIVINDFIHDTLDFYLGDFDGSGSPVRFVDGTPSCNLSFDFVSFASTTDDVDFLNLAGASITPNPVDNIDPLVRGLKLKPKGKFATKVGSTTPSCQFEFSAIAQ